MHFNSHGLLNVPFKQSSQFVMFISLIEFSDFFVFIYLVIYRSNVCFKHKRSDRWKILFQNEYIEGVQKWVI